MAKEFKDLFADESDGDRYTAYSRLREILNEEYIDLRIKGYRCRDIRSLVLDAMNAAHSGNAELERHS